MLTVAKALSNAGRITGTRLQRLAGGSTKALGLSKDFHLDDDTEEVDDADAKAFEEKELKNLSGRDPISGAPISLFESAYELVLAGFHPLTCEPLGDKMHSIVKTVIDDFVESLKIPISESIEAFIIPG